MTQLKGINHNYMSQHSKSQMQCREKKKHMPWQKDKKTNSIYRVLFYVEHVVNTVYIKFKITGKILQILFREKYFVKE